MNITQPATIAKYNRCMGGTDSMDQNLNLYRISVRSKKWWWALFAFCVDVALQFMVLAQMWSKREQKPAVSVGLLM